MKVEFLYFDGCPNWRRSLEDVNTVLKEYHVTAEVELVEVTSQEQAESLAFLGSPTVRIDGMDVEPDIPDSGYGMDLRVYMVEEEEEGTEEEERPVGRPPREWIAAAVEVALE